MIHSLRWDNAGPRLEITGTPGHPYIIEASTNLIQWTPIATNRLVLVSTNLTDGGAPGHPTRFYRAGNWRGLE